jgi:hypothetical protein
MPAILRPARFTYLQSAYRQGHSTETALLCTLNDVFHAANDTQFTVVIGLDISAAFDTIDHGILIDRLQEEYGISSVALRWLGSYLRDRKQFVKIGRHSSSIMNCVSGVPQGSVLGPLLFSVYTSPVGDVISSFGVRCHQYADDTQLYLSMRSAQSSDGLSTLAACTAAVKRWYLLNGLLLNPTKSEAIVLGTDHQLRNAGDIQSVTVADATLPVSSEFKSLGVVIDSRLTFEKHAKAVAKACHFHLRAIQHIRSHLTQDLANTLAVSLVSSRLDYCNSLLHGAPSSTINILQRVQNCAARVVTQSSRLTSARPLLQSLHWLPVAERIEFKLDLLTFKTHTTRQPSYLLPYVLPSKPARSLRSSDHFSLIVPHGVNIDFARRGFSFAAPSVFNSLPVDVRDCFNVNVFKILLKTFLFNRTFKIKPK